MQERAADGAAFEMRSRHCAGQPGAPPALRGVADQIPDASDMQRGEKSSVSQPFLVPMTVSQALRNFAYAAENPSMCRLVRACGSLFVSGSKPKISISLLSSRESTTFCNRGTVRVSMPADLPKGRSMRNPFTSRRSGLKPAPDGKFGMGSRVNVRRIDLPAPQLNLRSALGYAGSCFPVRAKKPFAIATVGLCISHQLVSPNDRVSTRKSTNSSRFRNLWDS